MATEIEIQHGDTFGISHFDSNGIYGYVPKGKDFKMTCIYEDIDTGAIYYDIEAEKLGQKRSFRISKDEATDSKLVQAYASYGLDVNSGNSRIVCEVMQKKEDEYIRRKRKVKEVYSVAGVKNNEIYAGETNPLTQGEYIGHLDLTPKGDKELWFSFVCKEMLHSVEIMFTIAVSFAAILLGFLRDFLDIDNLIVHLRSDSSSGKTTMMYLAISSFGNPRENNPNGLISTWNGTKNAILRRLMQVKGVLLGLDEFSMMKDKDVSNLVYSISSGIEKDRLTRDAKVQNRLVGTYILFSTGEASILSKCNGNIGLSVRVLEMDSHKWTKDAAQSERIKSFVKQNYGHAATEFGLKLHQWIQQHGMDALVERLDYWRTYYCERCTIQARKERMSSRYGLILLAADLAKEFFDMPMDVDALNSFIIENEDSAGDNRNSYDDFYEKLVAYLLAQNSHFAYYEQVKNSNKVILKRVPEEWGLREEVHGEVEIDGTYAKYLYSISVPFFDKIVYSLGYEDPKALRKFLKENDYTFYESDRGTTRKVLDGIRFTCVSVYVPGGNATIYNKDLPTPEKQRKQRRIDLINRFRLYGALMDSTDYASIYCELESMEAEMSADEAKEWSTLKFQLQLAFQQCEGMATEDIHNHSKPLRHKRKPTIDILDADDIIQDNQQQPNANKPIPK